jgi:hypothetical protein
VAYAVARKRWLVTHDRGAHEAPWSAVSPMSGSAPVSRPTPIACGTSWRG